MDIFKESSIAGIKLKNRIIRSATHEGMADSEGRPLSELGKLYVRLAKGGAGAIITGFTGIQKSGKGAYNMCIIDSDESVDGYMKINEQLRPYGVPLIMQLVHCGAKTNRDITGEDVVAPSKFKNKLYGSTARALDEDEIEALIDSFVKAIVRSKKAGFAGVQLHIAHGYLLSQFLSPYINRRRDRWGGSLENRFRIVREIIGRAREKAGSYPLFAKISSYDGDKNGVKIEEGVRISELLQQAGIDALEVSCGGVDDGFNTVRSEKMPVEAITSLVPRFRDMPALKKKFFSLAAPLILKKHQPVLNYNISAARMVKQSVDIPVIAVGGIRKLDDIRLILDSGDADYISMARPFIIEPDIVEKFRTGKQLESRCLNCGYCLFGVFENRLKCYYGRIN